MSSLTRRHFLRSTSAVALTSAAASSAPASETSRAGLSQARNATVAQATPQISEKRTIVGVPSATAMQRADELLRKMTIEEKAMQLSSIFPLALFDTKGTNHSQLDALMDCVSEACKNQCSPQLDNRSRPKWCMYFNEPDASHASQVEGKSAE